MHLLIKLVYYLNLLCFIVFLAVFIIDIMNNDSASMTSDFYWMAGNTFFVLLATYASKMERHD